MSNPDILLINPPFHKRIGSGNFLPLGLGYIMSAVYNAGFTVDVINCAEFCQSLAPEELNIFEKFFTDKLHEYDPLLIGIGPCITSHIRALPVISNACKSVHPNTPIMCGGPLATMSGQEWFFFEKLNIPYIIKGDGEEAIPSIIRGIKSGSHISACPSISFPDHLVINEISDINSIAFPFRENSGSNLFSERRKTDNEYSVTMPMITSRGCAYSCDYCASGSMSTGFRKRSNENIIEEMLYLRDSFGATDIIFYDDCFFNNPSKSATDVNAFCNLLLSKKVGMTWQIELRTDLLLSLTDDSIILLEKAGCRQINLGIEKTNTSALQELGKTSEIQGLKEKNKHITEISHIRITATFILGGINENEESVKQLIKESKELSLSQAHFNPLFVYPATKLYKKCGYGTYDWYDLIQKDALPWGEIVFENDILSATKILSLLDFAYTEFYGSTNGTYINPYLNRFNLGGDPR